MDSNPSRCDEHWQHWPQCWYVVARASQLKRGRILSGHLGGHAWVLYRSADGRLHATDAFCPHMGAHLQSATVAGDALRCGLHACHIRPGSSPQPPAAITGGCDIPVRAWPCHERFGLVWLHPPAAQAPPPPFQDVENAHHWLTAGPRRIAADWRAMICNGFDLAHMSVVHQRDIAAPPVFTRLGDNTLQMVYRTRILPRGGLSSWLMQKLSGGHIDLVHSCAGSSIMVQSRVGRFRTTGIFALLPQDAPATPPEKRQTLAFAAVGIPRASRFARLQLWLARALYLAFLKKDFVVVENMRLQLCAVDDPGVQAVSAYQRDLSAIPPPK